MLKHASRFSGCIFHIHDPLVEALSSGQLNDEWVVKSVPERLDVSRFGEGDVLVSDSKAEALATLQHIIGTPALSDNPGDRWRRRQIDRHHASAALLAHADAPW